MKGICRNNVNVRKRENLESVLSICQMIKVLSMQVLAVNAAKDSIELVAKLRAYHHNAQTKADKQHLSGYV